MALYEAYLPEIPVLSGRFGGVEAEEAFALASVRAGLAGATHGD